MKYAVIIPARYKSTRFPGKPLADLNGKPMIQHVWEKCVSAVGNELVYVATDDRRIEDAVVSFGGKVVLTPSSCLTGTDRLAEANKILGLDFVINVQGDEPMISPDDILKVKDEFLLQKDMVINAYTKIQENEDVNSTNLPKVVVSKTQRLLYMSRSAIPKSKSGESPSSFKQVCIYAFSKIHLDFFLSFREKTALEDVEDIEILRFLENDIPVSMVHVENVSIAVDTEEDLQRARILMQYD